MTRYTLDQAAARLGVSVHTVRRRVKAGQLHAEREPVRGGFRWVVLLGTDASTGAEPAHEAHHERAHNGTVDSHLLSQVLSERDHLRSVVADQQRTIDRLTILLKDAQDSRPLLTEAKPVDTHVATHEAIHEAKPVDMPTAAPRRPWWRLWRRGKGNPG